MDNYDHTEAATPSQLLLLSDHDEVEAATAMLRSEGYAVEQRGCSHFAASELASWLPDAILIDLKHPSVQSLSICRELRCCYEGPILVLAARTSDIVQILGLEMGADDFLFKPQPDTLLLAKLRAFLRRAEEMGQRQGKTIQLGDLVIDGGRREVCSNGEPVELTSREFDLLWCLAENVRSVLSREEIHQALYRREYNGYDRSIDIYISRIRQKIGDCPQKPRYLKTVRGAGYLLVENSS
jgi:two-component system response regulator RstA